ncbi:MAG: hypothetical protein GXX90_06115, partial [Microbacteriaceae bacterium]|nr:hypothetical protein [Microbacteriaceae bacterium]
MTGDAPRTNARRAASPAPQARPRASSALAAERTSVPRPDAPRSDARATASPAPNAPRGDVRWLLAFARPATARLAGSIAARLVGHALGAVLLALPLWAVGLLATGRAAGAGFIVAVLIVLAVAALAKAGLRYLEQLLGHLAAFSLMGELRVWMIDRLLPQAPAVADGEGAARLHTVGVRDVDRVEVFFAHTIAPAVTAVAIPLAAVAVAAATAGPAPAAALAAVLALVASGCGDDSSPTSPSADVTAVATTTQVADFVREVGG